MGMTQVHYDKMVQEKKFLSLVYHDANNRGVECLVVPCFNGGAFDPIIEFTKTRWFHWSTLGMCGGSKNVMNAVNGTKFKTSDGVTLSGKEVYGMALKLVE